MTAPGSELWRLDAARTRSISAENPTGAPGAGARAVEGTGAAAARLLGPGWKISPSIELAMDETATLAEVSGPGVFRHLWLTTARTVLRQLILRIYWDNAPEPAIELPLGDFFCNGWDELALVSSEMVVVAPAGGLNSFWPMPFRESARITLHNGSDRSVPLYYQATYSEEDVPDSAGYLNAQWRHSNPLGDPAVHPILDTVPGPGRYVGTYLAIQPGAPGWWGEGELKFYLDGDTTHPTLCGTGTEDYFGGAWNFDLDGGYRTYSTPYLGLHQVLPPNEIYQPDQQFGMYRWHVRDPICFHRDLRVTLQALGWRDDKTYLPLTNARIASTALWYQSPRTTRASKQ
ncbi:glycoside hydrolase family 172 protein [Nocardia sp. NBC_00403]|uniref:glycoside hydrolase family 172 protein n=1 Tax=Nocardia sp. NBC_00403 TaxID=2975990 RepID=UPI002E221404